MSESNFMRRVMLEAAAVGVTLFRNNVGSARTHDGRWINFGLVKGSSDLIGYTPIVIDGERVAVFTAVEVKGRHTRVTKEQTQFLARVRAMGGIAALIREGEDIHAALESAKKEATR